MLNKRKNDADNDQELPDDEPEIWYTGKLKRDAPFWQRIRYGTFLPTILMLQTSCLIVICIVIGLILSNRITLQPLQCILSKICPTLTPAFVSAPTNGFTLVPRTLPPFDTPTSTVASTAVKTRTPPPSRTSTPAPITAIGTLKPTFKASPSSACDSASPERPASQIAFISNAQYGDGAVYLLDLESKQICLFFTHSPGIYNPVWSPDGKHIAFTDSQNLWLADNQGKNQQRLDVKIWARDTVNWSPDSQKIIFSSQDEDLTIYYLSSKTAVRITGNNLKAHTPRWSPDGKSIVAIVGRGVGSDLYVMDANGNNPQQITTNNLQEDMPDWSVNSQEIIYAAQIDGMSAIFVMNRDGTNIRRLSDIHHDARFPTVSSTAGSILFMIRGHRSNEIGVMDWNGASYTVVTDNSDNETMPTWRR